MNLFNTFENLGNEGDENINLITLSLDEQEIQADDKIKAQNVKSVKF